MHYFLQAVHTSAASEAVQILSTLSQQGGDVGAVLGSAGAAEAIVRATLINEDIGHFKSHKYGISESETLTHSLPPGLLCYSILA